MDSFFNNFSQLHFLRPECFYILIPLAMFWILKIKVDDNTHWHQVLPVHLARVLLTDEQQKQKRNTWLIPLLWLIATAAMAGPTWQKIEKPVFQVKRASVIVMDMSMSMRSTDMKPNRLAKSKFKAIDLANAIEDGEIALVAYAGDAFTISPLTPDSKNIVNLIPSLSPEIMPEQGSYPLLGLTKATELLQQAGFVKGDVYWFTDGVELEEVDELNKFISSTPYNINVIAFGTAEGAPIQMVDKSLLKDHRGSIVIPKLNTQQLAQLATIGKGVFVKSTASDIDIKTLLSSHAIEQSAPDEQQKTDDKLLTGDDWQEAGPYLVILLLPFLLYAFRRGVTLSIFAVMFVANTPDASATEQNATNPPGEVQITPTSWQDFVFNTKDQVATGDYQKGNYAQAQATFENPQWKGSAAYKAGDYESALNYFEQDQSDKGLYNQGNTLAQLGKLDEAIEAYEQALKQNPEHAEAKANKALLEQMKQQQEQQQQNQQQSQQEQQQQGGQQQDQEQSDNSQNNSEQDQNNQQQSDSQQQNQSQSQPEPTAQENESDEQNKDKQESEQNSEQNSEQESDKQEGQQQESQQQNESEGEEQNQQQAAQLTPEQLAEQEAQQKLEQLLRKVSDDPSVLLRNKMILESRKRQQFGRPPKGADKSW